MASSASLLARTSLVEAALALAETMTPQSLSHAVPSQHLALHRHSQAAS